METIVFVLEMIIFIPFGVWVLYFLLYAIGYRLPRQKVYPSRTEQHRFLVIFPAYKEDAVIVESVQKFLLQQYPNTHYQVCVVADDMQPETVALLRGYPIQVLIPDYSKRSKAAALKLAMAHNVGANHDAVVILDADNHVDVDFLQKVNTVFASGNTTIQVHRVAKNQDSDIAYLDGLSEEINNAIFRKGHNNLGLPAALSGSGMVFEVAWFRETMQRIDAVGEDKELEYYLLQDRMYTTYLEDVYVYDEKVNRKGDMSNQRRRWIAAQLDVFIKIMKEVGTILRSRNWAMLDKLLQWSMPPRIILLAWGPLWIVIFWLLEGYRPDRWILLYGLFLLSLLLALPNHYYTKRTCLAFLKLPSIFIAILRSFIGLKTARTTFIHTPHGK